MPILLSGTSWPGDVPEPRLLFVRGRDASNLVEHLRESRVRVLGVQLQRTRWQNNLTLGRGLLKGEPLLAARDRFPPMSNAFRH